MKQKNTGRYDKTLFVVIFQIWSGRKDWEQGLGNPISDWGRISLTCTGHTFMHMQCWLSYPTSPCPHVLHGGEHHPLNMDLTGCQTQT